MKRNNNSIFALYYAIKSKWEEYCSQDMGSHQERGSNPDEAASWLEAILWCCFSIFFAILQQDLGCCDHLKRIAY